MLQLLRQITAQEEAWRETTDHDSAAKLRLASEGRATIIKRNVVDLTEEDDPSLLEMVQLH